MNKRLLQVLLVEDDEDDFLLMSKLLGEITNFNFATQWAKTYEAAKKALDEKNFDVCLVDYRLGEHTGLELLRETCVEGFCAPMILITGQDDHAVDLEAMKAGAADYLIKGKTEAVLLERTIRYALERKRTEDALEEAAKRERTMIANALDVICTIDAEGRFVSINPACFKMLGYRPEELIGRRYLDFVAPEDISKTVATEQNILSGAEITDFENCYRHKNGTFVNLIWTCYWSESEHLIFAVAHDITERKRMEEILRESEYKLRTLIESMQEGLLQVSKSEVIEFVNDRFCEMIGYRREELLGKTTYEILLGESEQEIIDSAKLQRLKGVSGQYEMRLKKKNGEDLWVIIGGAPVVGADGRVAGSIGIHTDITERKRAEEQLLHDALHDGLTGLPNRALFMEHLRMTMERGKRQSGKIFAVLFLDFDRFKIINDSLGHTEGDNLLKQIAARLESSLRSSDLVARFGGDEFTILLNEIHDESDALRITERILEDLKIPFDLSGREVFVSASIGIALSLIGYSQAEEMLRDADIAMYRAKSKGKARYQLFDQTMHKQALNQLQIETEMRFALEREEFCLYYQPIIKLATNDLVGFEALVRWNHPERGLVPPMEFIPIAEESGLILPLGDWILRKSCQQLRKWQNHNSLASAIAVSVNLSSKQFMQFDLAEKVAATLKETDLSPSCLKLEITESYILDNAESAIETLKRLRALGIEISLDDFGTGYSSLSYLHNLPIDYLKIDRSFISRMEESRENSEIVQTIIRLAQSLKMKVVAEGIETAAQLEQLQKLKCEYGQGYFFSKPLKSSAAALINSAKTGS